MLETVTLYLPGASSPAAELGPKNANEPSLVSIDDAPRGEVTSAGLGGTNETTTSSPDRTRIGCPLSSNRPFTFAPDAPMTAGPRLHPTARKAAQAHPSPAIRTQEWYV